MFMYANQSRADGPCDVTELCGAAQGLLGRRGGRAPSGLEFSSKCDFSPEFPPKCRFFAKVSHFTVAVPHTGPWPQRYKLCLTSEAKMMSLTQALSSPLSTDGAQGKHSPLYLHF